MSNVSYVHNYIEAAYGATFDIIECANKIKKIVIEIPDFNYRAFHYWDKRFNKDKTIDSVKVDLSVAFLSRRDFNYSRVK